MANRAGSTGATSTAVWRSSPLGRTIGAAADFYRLRVVRIDQGSEPELDWRDDVLYRHQEDPRVPAESVVFRVEAVSLDDDDDDDSASSLEDFRSSEEAYAFLEEAAEDLACLTKSRFEDRYGIPTA